MMFDATPVVDKADNDEECYHHYLDHREPIFGFPCKETHQYVSSQSKKENTVDSNVDQLQKKYWYNDDNGPMPWLKKGRPISKDHGCCCQFTRWRKY